MNPETKKLLLADISDCIEHGISLNALLWELTENSEHHTYTPDQLTEVLPALQSLTKQI